MKVLNLVTWNVQTLLDNIKANRPERTAMVARELAQYNVDIAALSETRFADKEQLTELNDRYTFLWSGRNVPNEVKYVWALPLNFIWNTSLQSSPGLQRPPYVCPAADWK